MDYHVCVRVAEGYCGIMYTPTGPESFLLNGETPYNNTKQRKNLVSACECVAVCVGWGWGGRLVVYPFLSNNHSVFPSVRS